MTSALPNYNHYAVLWVPRCALTYGVLPCHAQLSKINGGTINAVDIDGDLEYTTRGAGLSGAADSKLVTMNFWANFASISLLGYILDGVTSIGGGGFRWEMRMTTSGTIRTVAKNSADSDVLDFEFSIPAADKWTHIIFSIDLTSTSKRWVYVDGVAPSVTWTTYVNDNIDFTLADWGFSQRPDNLSGRGIEWRYADFWFAPGQYVDLSVAANRDKFRTESQITTGFSGRPADLGSGGATPTGTQPLVFFRSAAASVGTNSGTGGNFTATGSSPARAFDTDFATGDIKCFNSLGTCQDIANFDNSGETRLFFYEDVVDPQAYTIYAFPFVKSIQFNSAIVSLGDNMGQRGSVSVTLRDASHNDQPTSQFDKYLSERDYDPITQGTFWGKFRARNPYMRFARLQIYSGKKGPDGLILEGELFPRNYIVESISGPNSDGEVTITGKDTLKVADGDFAQAPEQSAGFLASDITSVATTATMSPTGTIADYPSSGYICIGGSEIVAYTKAGGDVLNITRSAFNTAAVDHKAQDRLQLVLYYNAQSPDLIIADLLTTYGGVDSATIDADAWAAEVDANLNTVYSFILVEPTPVANLISEIIQQIGGAIWWDDVNSQIRLQILKAVATDAERWNEDNVLASSLVVADQETKRVTRVSVYFGQHNPTLKVDETRNYDSVATVMDEAMENLVGGSSIKTVFARGIANGGRTVAERLAQKYLSRYVQPPRKFNFDLMRYAGLNPVLGGGYLLGGGTLQYGVADRSNWPLQDETGARVEVPIQVTRLMPIGPKFQVEAEEMLFTAYGDDVDPTNHTVIYDVSRNNVNLQETHDSIYAAAVSGDTVNCYVPDGVTIGSSSITVPAFVVGTFVAGVTVNIFVAGRIQGKGGRGAGFPASTKFAEAGGTALYTRQNITLDSTGGEIWGGGGGGGVTNGQAGGSRYSNSGGGGAGTLPGDAGIPYALDIQNPANAGTTEVGGTAPFSPQGGNGGDPGQAGQNASGGAFLNTSGGAAGNAIDGNSFITFAATGDHRGPTIN